MHVLFDESIPERSADYFRQLDEATVKSYPKERRLVGQHHIDDGRPYKTTRVVVRRGLIVDFCVSHYCGEAASGEQDSCGYC